MGPKNGLVSQSALATTQYLRPDKGEKMEDISERAQLWKSTMSGFTGNNKVVYAHQNSNLEVNFETELLRSEREETQLQENKSATVVEGSGNRVLYEDADPVRTCFEKDRDRILHSSAFRRLAGKTQVFVHPADHQRTRLTHALEVAQVARSITKRLRLNVDLAEAIALGHDCGHGPGGHASEDALSTFLPDGYDHAVIGADLILAPLNLCLETLDGIRNHSWSRPEPLTPEGLIVSWSDRIAYCAHDLEDAISAKLIMVNDLPDEITDEIGTSRSEHLNYFINAIVTAALTTGRIAMFERQGSYLGALRSFNYEHIYLRSESIRQSEQVIEVLRTLTKFLIANPKVALERIGLDHGLSNNEEDFIQAIVTYVGGMTDRYAFTMAMELAGVKETSVPRGIDFL